MLKVRVIPTMLWRDFGLVKGVGFDSWRRTGPILPSVKVYNNRDVDALIVVDIIATAERRPPDAQAVAGYSSYCSMPLTVGGGISTVEDIGSLLNADADKVSINSALFSEPALITAGARRFGSQCMVASIDTKKADDRTTCWSHSGQRNTGRDPVGLARELEDRGAGEILLTSIDRDGGMTGYDLATIAAVSECVDIPVIASGGAGCYEDMVKAVRDAGASAVAAASMFHFTEQTPLGAKQALEAAGIPIRRNWTPAPAVDRA